MTNNFYFVYTKSIIILGRRAKKEAEKVKSNIPKFSSLEEKQKFFFQEVGF